MSLLEIKNLCKEYNGVVPLKNINLTVERGEVISIIGPSGTGKSTFIFFISSIVVIIVPGVRSDPTLIFLIPSIPSNGATIVPSFISSSTSASFA